MIVSNLVRTMTEGVQDTENRRCCRWPRILSALHKTLVKALPFTAIRIVIVVLQIVTQVRALKNDQTTPIHTPVKIANDQQ